MRGRNRTGMATTNEGSRPLELFRTITSSPALFLLTLGGVFVVGGVLLSTGVWPAMMVVWGAALLIAGSLLLLGKRWIERKSR